MSEILVIAVVLVLVGAVVFGLFSFSKKRKAAIQAELAQRGFNFDMFYFLDFGFIALELDGRRMAIGKNERELHIYPFEDIKAVQRYEKGNRTVLKVMVTDLRNPSHTISFNGARTANSFYETLFAAVA